jgi:thioredoxin reductase (NADPH)
MTDLMRNVIIIGSGPAGHTAALYLARANLAPLLLEGDSTGNLVSGGLLTTTKTVENYPGFPEGVDGFDLTEKFREQSLKFGTEIVSENAVRIERGESVFDVVTKQRTYKAKAVLVATGSTPRGLSAPGWDTFWHKGISTCAVCDGGLPVYRNVPLAVVGGGDSACEEALHLSHTASKVYLIHRRGELRASKIMADRVLKNPKIEMVWNREVAEIKGGKHLEQLILRDTVSGGLGILAVRGLFVAIGHDPNSEFVKGTVQLDPSGYIITNEKKETNVKGIWAAGDVQDPHYRQAITAAGSGCVAALEIERYLHLL